MRYYFIPQPILSLNCLLKPHSATYLPNCSPSSMVSGKVRFNVSGKRRARRPASTELTPNIN